MSYPPYNGLSFQTLREANLKRVGHFKNARGEPAHSSADGSDWTPAQWAQAVMGELGEYANLRKKFERGDIDGVEFTTKAAEELADVVTYLDLLAYHVGVDLGRATADKFNKVSQRVGSPIEIDYGADDWRMVSGR